MGQEFFINSQTLEDKIRQLLPSQGGAGAGFDLSASTQIIPVIDVTESAEGSDLREDLQSSFSFTTTNSFALNGATDTVIITNTGYFKVQAFIVNSTSGSCNFNLFDGTSAKNIISSTVSNSQSVFVEFMVFLSAGDSLRATASIAATNIAGSFRQIADIDGNLVNP